MATGLAMSNSNSSSSNADHNTSSVVINDARNNNTISTYPPEEASSSAAAITTNEMDLVVEALYAYSGDDANHLHFAKGDLIEVWGQEPSGWWDGVLLKSRLTDRNDRGWFPSNYVKVLSPQDTYHLLVEHRRKHGSMQQRVPSRPGSTAHSPRSAAGPGGPAAIAGGLGSGPELARVGRSDHQQQDILEGPGLDILLGRRGTDQGPDIDQVLRWNPASAVGGGHPGTDEDDLTSFSSGGDIFGEIAAAAAEEHRTDRSTIVVGGSKGANTLPSNIFASQQVQQHLQQSQQQSSTSSQMNATNSSGMATSLLPAHDIVNPAAPSNLQDTRSQSQIGLSNVIDPDWVPKVSDDGRIFYYNIRTGQKAYDLPSPSTSSNASHHLRSESGTIASDKTKWTSGSTSVSDLHLPDTSGTGTITSVASTAPTTIQQRKGRSDTASSYGRPLSSFEGSSNDGVTTGPSSSRYLLSPRDPEEVTNSSQSQNWDFGDMSLERDLQHSLTPRKASIVAGESASKTAAPTVSEKMASRIQYAEQIAAFPKAPTLARLERNCSEALAELSTAVQQRSEMADSRRVTAGSNFHSTELQCRRKLEDAALRVNNATRQLLAATDIVLEQPQNARPANDSASSSTRSSLDFFYSDGEDGRTVEEEQPLPPLNPTDFRPLAMKITATESKLMLSVRTNWGLLATSPEEEASVDNSSLTDGLAEDEIAALYSQRNIQLASRRDVDAKLRFDLLVQIRTLGDAISAFVEHVEAYASSRNCTVGKNGLVAPLLTQAALSIRTNECFVPATSTSGSLKGHGFEYYWQSSASGSSSSQFFLKPANRPRRVLSAKVLQDMQSDRTALLGDLTALKTIFQTVFGSQFSAWTLNVSLVPTVARQTNGLLARLARFLKELEDINIASRLDVLYDVNGQEITKESVRSTQAAPSADEEAIGQYTTDLRSGTALLYSLLEAKRLLYSLPSRVLLVLQSLTLQASPHGPISSNVPPTQPTGVSPLGTRTRFSSSSNVQGGTILQVLSEGSGITASILSHMSELNAIADRQKSATQSLRQANLVLRAKASETERTWTVRMANEFPERSGYSQKNADDDTAEELDTDRGTTSSLNGTVYTPRDRNSVDRTTIASDMLMRTPSTSSIAHRQLHTTRASRSNSLAESLASDGSRFSDLGQLASDDSRTNGVDGTRKDSPSNHSPSKSKLKQFFGDEAPGSIIHRPPRIIREIPNYLQQDYTHDQITFSMDNSIKAGTLHALVCRLTNHMSADTQFNAAFLMTYRTFTDANELLERLKSRYYLEPPPDIKGEEYNLWVEQKQKLVRARVINVIRFWITDHLYEEDESGLLDRISAFAVTLPNDSSQQIARIIERRRVTGAPRRMTASISGGLTPAPIVPRNMRKIRFIDIDPLEIARQFTIMDSRLFAKITVEECLAKAWPKKFGNKPTPNFTAIAEMSNAVTIWVAMTIVTQTDLRRRAAVVKHFITIADKCRQLSNFTTLMHIVAGLESSAIYRLRRTWELINQRFTATHTFLRNLMSPENNHALYRDALRLVGSPCVPFLGVYFTDWVMSGEANSDMLRDKPDQINFAKRAKVADSVQQIQLHQATPYNLAAVPQLQTWIDGELRSAMQFAQVPSAIRQVNVPPTVNDLMTRAYDLSLTIEPREREDERIARLLSESGFL